MMSLQEAQNEIKIIASMCNTNIANAYYDGLIDGAVTRSIICGAMRLYKDEIKRIPYTRTEEKVFLHTANYAGVKDIRNMK